MSEQELQDRAEQLWPDQPHLQDKWVQAARYLQQAGKWVLYGGEVTWRAG